MTVVVGAPDPGGNWCVLVDPDALPTWKPWDAGLVLGGTWIERVVSCGEGCTVGAGATSPGAPLDGTLLAALEKPSICLTIRMAVVVTGRVSLVTRRGELVFDFIRCGSG
mmetsp:Transcript_132436/g.230297  ORF Transcript_132436/g.230297 Transcript_132436/m.230297 type:complete len:110 (+) Transcript_132436:374-703(+)